MSEPVNVWWVNQGKTYEASQINGVLWAPLFDQGGGTPSHWKSMDDVCAGDVIVNANHGLIRGVSRAKSPVQKGVIAVDKSKDAEFSESGEGRWIEIDLHEFQTPLNALEISEPLMKLHIEHGPYAIDKRIKQGYLFHFSPEGLQLVKDLSEEQWPDWAVEPLEALSRPTFQDADLLDEFIYWGSRIYENDHFDKQERNYKIRFSERLGTARTSFLNGEDDWFLEMKRSFFGRYHQVHFYSADNFLKWYESSIDRGNEALRIIWTDAEDDAKCVGEFLSFIPWEEFSGGAARLSVASFLRSAVDPFQVPVYRPSVFIDAMERVSYPRPDESLVDGDLYRYVLSFTDQLLEEAAKRNLVLRDRLDVQSLLWAVYKWGDSEEVTDGWSEEDIRAYRTFLGVEAPSEEQPSDEILIQRSLADVADELLIDLQYLEEIEGLLEEKGQAIFYGPPGTGKTYIARELARHFASDNDSVELVQFHPSYAYEDFVEGFRPRTDEAGSPRFALVEGPLKRIARQAAEHPEQQHVLVIDEINRGNVAKVLGELYFLLEYRDEEIYLQYSEHPFRLPGNLWIIGTMNTADRSIALIDAALRRRFYFVPFFPDEPPIQGLLRRWLQVNNPDYLWVADVLDTANRELGDRHMAIGPSYFMKEQLDDSWVDRIWKHAVLPYIAEQFFGEEERLDEFQLERLRLKKSLQPVLTENSDEISKG